MQHIVDMHPLDPSASHVQQTRDVAAAYNESAAKSVERDLRKRYAAELLFLTEAQQQAYLADESARHALAFVRRVSGPVSGQ